MIDLANFRVECAHGLSDVSIDTIRRVLKFVYTIRRLLATVLEASDVSSDVSPEAPLEAADAPPEADDACQT
jgi:hypothetical protein